MRVDRTQDMLGIIDVQPTFMQGGELPVPDGHAVVPTINGLLRRLSLRAFATQDWHPEGHASFASQHQGRAPFDEVDLSYGRQTLWPDHAIQGTPGAGLHPDLDACPVELVVRKGTRREIDSYSAFLENDRKTPTGLAGALHDLGMRRVLFCGLALDYCVAWSAEHAVQAGFEAYVVEDATRAIGSEASIRQRFADAGVRLISSVDLIA